MVAALLLAAVLSPFVAPLVTPAPAPLYVHVKKVSVVGPAYGRVDDDGERPDGVSRKDSPKCPPQDVRVTQAPDMSFSKLDLGSSDWPRQTIVSHGSRAPPA